MQAQSLFKTHPFLLRKLCSRNGQVCLCLYDICIVVHEFSHSLRLKEYQLLMVETFNPSIEQLLYMEFFVMILCFVFFIYTLSSFQM